MAIRKTDEKYNDIMEETIYDINVNEENLDGIFYDFESKYLERYVGRAYMDEYVFYDPDGPEKHRHHDIGSHMGITANYDTVVDISSFTMTGDDDYNKLM